MGFCCADVLQMYATSPQRIEVVAGAEHLNRAIRWVYVAEAMDSILSTLNWLSGHELVIVTGSSNIGSGDDVLVEYVRRCAQKRVAGIVINTGKYIPQVPEAAIQAADTLGIPLMVVPWETKLVEFTKDICTAIVERMIRDESTRALADNLLFGQQPLNAGTQLLLQQCGFDSAPGYLVAILRMEDHSSTLISRQMERRAELAAFVQRMLEGEQYHCIDKQLGDDLICILRLRDRSAAYRQVFERIDAALRRQRLAAIFSIGVGKVCQSLAEIPESYASAQQVLRFFKFTETQRVAYFDGIDLHFLLLSIPDQRVLRNYYLDLFSPLIEYDRNNHASLMQTLAAYIAHDASLSATAKALFVHENTLKYRLNKIRALLHIDPGSLEDQVRVSVALKIGDILDMAAPASAAPPQPAR